MARALSELLCHLPEHKRAPFLFLPEENQRRLRLCILSSKRLPRSAEELSLAPATVAGPAIGRTRERVRPRVGLEPAAS